MRKNGSVTAASKGESSENPHPWQIYKDLEAQRESDASAGLLISELDDSFFQVGNGVIFNGFLHSRGFPCPLVFPCFFIKARLTFSDFSTSAQNNLISSSE
jgi:hypothetical protein